MRGKNEIESGRIERASELTIAKYANERMKYEAMNK